MSKDLTKPDNHDLSTQKVLYLMNLSNGRVFPWSALLAVRKGFIDCTIDGQPINPKDVPGNHPWIRQQTQALASRMRFAGANPDTMEDFGRQLTEDAAAKFKTLEYEKATQLGLENSKSAASAGMMVRVQKNIDKHVERVKGEIDAMVYIARTKLGLF